MIVAYPLANQSDYTELRYSLRSIDKYLPKPFEVVIIGDKIPDWVTSVTFIELPDIPNKRQLSVRRKILASLAYAKGEILFMNDDFHFLKQTDIPYYFNGQLKSYGYGGSKQLQDRLKELKKPAKHFDLHYPMIFKQDFIEIMENFPGDCLIRSAYCNYLGIEGVQNTDCKFLKPTKPDVAREYMKGKSFISTGEHSLHSLLPILAELFPQRCIFEV